MYSERKFKEINIAVDRIFFSMYRCECPAGFEGTNCETNIDECEVKSNNLRINLFYLYVINGNYDFISYHRGM